VAGMPVKSDMAALMGGREARPSRRAGMPAAPSRASCDLNWSMDLASSAKLLAARGLQENLVLLTFRPRIREVRPAARLVRAVGTRRHRRAASKAAPFSRVYGRRLGITPSKRRSTLPLASMARRSFRRRWMGISPPWDASRWKAVRGGGCCGCSGSPDRTRRAG
jgi:hypothetical protein